VLASASADWAEVRRLRVLFYTVLGIAYFGFLGSVFLTIVPIYGKNVLGLAEERSGLLLAILSIGVGAGAVLAGKLSRGQVEIGLVPLGALGLTVFGLDLALADRGTWTLPLFGVPARAGT